MSVQFEISPDLTLANTKVTVDGKPIKGKIVSIDWDMYQHTPYDSTTNTFGEAHPCFNCSVTTEVEDEDGTKKRFSYNYSREDMGEVEDSVKEITPKIEDIARDLANKMMGRKSVL